MSKVLIQIQKQIPVNIDTDVFIGGFKVVIDEVIVCGVITDIKGSIDVKPIPQTKEVEWENGDECRYANDIEHEYIYIGEHPHGDGHYVFSEEKGITYITNGYLLEPESPEAKKGREELEGAYHLYQMNNRIKSFSTVSFEEFKNKLPKRLEAWLAIVKETGYRMEK